MVKKDEAVIHSCACSLYCVKAEHPFAPIMDQSCRLSADFRSPSPTPRIADTQLQLM